MQETKAFFYKQETEDTEGLLYLGGPWTFPLDFVYVYRMCWLQRFDLLWELIK